MSCIGGTDLERSSTYWMVVQAYRRAARQIPLSTLRRDVEGRKARKVTGSRFQEKLRCDVKGARTANGHT